MLTKRLVSLLGIGLLALLAAGGPLPAAGQSKDRLPTIKQPDSLRFDVTGAMIFDFNPPNAPTSVPFHGSGAAVGPDSQVELRIYDPLEPNASASAITKDGKAYKRSTNNSWTGPDDQRLVSVQNLLDLSNFPTSGSLAHTGFLDLDLSRPALHVSAVAPDQVNGVAATRYDVAVDLQKLFGVSDVEMAAITITNQMTLSFWLGKSDGYLHKLTFDQKTSVPGWDDTNPAGAPLIPFEVKYTLTFHDFNTPVTIVAPSAALLNVPPPLPGSNLGTIRAVSNGLPISPAGIGQVAVMPQTLPQTGVNTSRDLLLWLGLGLGGLVLRGTLRRRALHS